MTRDAAVVARWNAARNGGNVTLATAAAKMRH
jgi:hypothetical protein